MLSRSQFPSFTNRSAIKKYYHFHADDPLSVLRNQVRRHSKGLSFPSASTTKHFEANLDGTFSLLKKPIAERSSPKKGDPTKSDGLSTLRKLHQAYEEQARTDILKKLKKLDPKTFELFGRRLLEAYGFKDVVVTKYSKDGGIDGHGKLNIGLTLFRVAFQCKRYTTRNVGLTELNEFRGALQGEHDQGIIFTTTSFTDSATKVASKPGATPIGLIPGTDIVNIMIEKRFGVQVEHIPVYNYALDLGIQ